ncbi:hypothetical protein [Synechococcus sp. SYN20]|uniref:hypothetical protein n=1 Tax=Synechococcus sp. SYN20 TaxID=1050714 RepID=UPI0016454742|nr:hypothetical protein [Synechococcus sp. SYN20]
MPPRDHISAPAMTYSVTFMTKQGASRTEHVKADSLFLAVQTCQHTDQVAKVLRIVEVQ